MDERASGTGHAGDTPTTTLRGCWERYRRDVVPSMGLDDLGEWCVEKAFWSGAMSLHILLGRLLGEGRVDLANALHAELEAWHNGLGGGGDGD